MPKIVCPICDEELGNCIDDVPEKCPICDTRKHEIIMELKSKEPPAFEMKPSSTADVSNISASIAKEFSTQEEEIISTKATNRDNKKEFFPSLSQDEENIKPKSSSKTFSSPIIEEENEPTPTKNFEEASEEIIFTDVPPVSEKKPWSLEEVSTENDEIQHISESPIVTENFNIGVNTFEPKPDIQDIETSFEDLNTPQYIPPSEGNSIISPLSKSRLEKSELPLQSQFKPESAKNIAKSLPTAAPKLSPADAIARQLAKKAVEEDEAGESSDGNSTAPVFPAKRILSNIPSKSGASCLEALPGYKYCSKCKNIYNKDCVIPCTCGNSKLEIVEKGFAPGDYLILYNSVRKAIAYFLLEKQGSIFIGRSSERGSDRDIDLSIAWKHYYYRNATSEEDFKEQMRLLKGISRKHALVRFDKDSGKYILFHLSDKNYTVAELPTGEKRVRAPQNRNRIDLESNTIISMGNQKDFIILRYKKISELP